MGSVKRLTDTVTRWRVVTAPDGSAAVLSDIQPGPVMGAPGGLSGWAEASDPAEWGSFLWACNVAAWLNGKQSTANMGRAEPAIGGVGLLVPLENIQAILDYLMTKNADLMRRLARGPGEAASMGPPDAAAEGGE